MDSNVEWLIEALLNGESVADFTPKSRMEEYLKAILSKSGTDNLPIPRSRIDALLYQLAQSGESEVLQPQTKTVTPALEAQTVTADEGYTLSKVNIEAANAVYNEGIQAERRQVWESLQVGGTRTNYQYAFANSSFTGKNFYPIYDIKPKTAQYLFYQSTNANYGGHLYLKDRLTECGVTLDTSECTDFRYMFGYAGILRGDLGTIDIRKNNSISGMLEYAGYYQDPLTIRLIVDENTKIDSFIHGNGVRWLYFEGVIAKSLNLSAVSLFDTECAKLIIENNLKNLVGTDLEGTLSFKLHEDVWAALDTTYPRQDGNTWQEYVQYTLGWGI